LHLVRKRLRGWAKKSQSTSSATSPKPNPKAKSERGNGKCVVRERIEDSQQGRHVPVRRGAGTRFLRNLVFVLAGVCLLLSYDSVDNTSRRVYCRRDGVGSGVLPVSISTAGSRAPGMLVPLWKGGRPLSQRTPGENEEENGARGRWSGTVVVGGLHPGGGRWHILGPRGPSPGSPVHCSWPHKFSKHIRRHRVHGKHKMKEEKLGCRVTGRKTM
jgi:hypothetical protein